MCHSCPMRKVVGDSWVGRFGMLLGVGEIRCLTGAFQFEVSRLYASETVYMLYAVRIGAICSVL